MELGGVMESIIRMCDGLPLTLEVAGKYLQGKQNCEVWEQTLHALEKAEKVSTVDERLWAKLRVSYDCLEPKEKEVFLDACTFFCTRPARSATFGTDRRPWTLREAKAAWSAAYKTDGSLLWQTLVDMSLVYSVEEHEFIKVQQQLKILGQNIAREPNNNDKLRFWEREVGLNILQTSNDLSEGKAIHALRLDEDWRATKIHIPRAALPKLKEVRFLEIIAPIVIDGAARKGESVPTEVLLLSCRGPDLFDPALQTQLAVLKLSYLDYLPRSIGRLSALKCVEIYQCNVESLPESFGQLSALNSLSFSFCHKLQTLPDSFWQLSALNSLSFYLCFQLKTLPHSFGQLSALNSLEFSYCYQLKTLPDSFGQLSALNSLSFFCCNSLQTLPDSFGQLSALNSLSFSHCPKLQTLPDSFGQLSALNSLSFSSCPELQTLPDSFGQLSALISLSFSYCSQLKTLPDSFGQLSALNSLSFSICDKLQSLPDSFGQLSALNSLKFNYCEELHTLPHSFGQLSALNSLSFSSCPELNTLPQSFGQLSALNSLSFSHYSQLKTLPQSFGQLSALNSLSFSHCHKLQTFPDSFGQLSALISLSFSYCSQLKTLPDSFGQLSALNSLSFSICDKLQSLPDSFGQLSALNSLKFNYCEELHTLPHSFGQLSALNSLSFSSCPELNTLPQSFGQLSALNSLSFSHYSQLKTLPQSFGQLSALNSLSFSHCHKLQTLPDCFGQLSALNSLSFSRCDKFQTLSQSCGQLSALTSIEFNWCPELHTLPDSFGQLSALNSLSFSHCPELQTLPDSFGQLSALISLSFSYCSQLKTLPESFGQLPVFDRVSFEHCEKLQTRPKSSWQLSALETLQLGSFPESLEHLSARSASKSVCADQELLNDECQGLETARRRVSRSVCVEEFIKNVEEGGEDGYFVSNIWLHNLAEHERNSLMSSLWGASYSEIHQTATTSLFARLENDVQFTVTGNDASRTFTKNYVRPGDIDDQLGIAAKADVAGVFSPVEIGKTKEPPAKKMKTVEFPPDEDLEQTIRDLLREQSRSDFRKVTFQDIALRLENIFKVDVSARIDHVKALILQEASRLIEGALRAQRPIFKVLEAMEVAAAEKYDDSGIVIDHGRKRLEEQVSRVVPHVEFAFDEGPPKRVVAQRSTSASTSKSLEQKMYHSHPLVFKTPNTDGSNYPSSSSSTYSAEQLATTWRSFRAAIKSNRHHSFCVSTDWISKLEDNEKETLALICFEAEYEMTCQTKTTTWYERMNANMVNERTTSGGCDNEPSTQNMEVVGSDINNPRTPQSGSSLGKRKNADQVDVTGGSVRPALKKATSQVQDENICTCHPQLLTVQCSSGSREAVNIEPPPGTRRKIQKFGDDLVFTTAAKKVGSEKISATVDRSFSMTTVDFPSGQERSINLKGTAIILLSCCLKPNNDHHQVRIKLSEICGTVKNESSNDQACNGMGLSTVFTNLFATRIDDEDDEDAWEEITLKLEDEGYQTPQYRRVLAHGDPSTTSNDLVWLSVSDIPLDGCDPLSVTLELRGDVIKRREIDRQQKIQRAHVLHFQNIPSDIVIFEGDVDTVRHGKSKLELKIRQRLEIFYYKPGTPIVRERTAWSAIGTAEFIDFDCCLDIRTEKFKFG